VLLLPLVLGLVLGVPLLSLHLVLVLVPPVLLLHTAPGVGFGGTCAAAVSSTGAVVGSTCMVVAVADTPRLAQDPTACCAAVADQH
jgi:uncharacterized membrane protein YdjX (TVP38/TMEM64 family)